MTMNMITIYLKRVPMHSSYMLQLHLQLQETIGASIFSKWKCVQHMNNDIDKVQTFCLDLQFYLLKLSVAFAILIYNYKHFIR